VLFISFFCVFYFFLFIFISSVSVLLSVIGVLCVLAAGRHVVRAKFCVVVIGDHNMARIGKRVIVIVVEVVEVVEVDIVALRLLLPVRRVVALNWWFLGQWL
jgi:hypothetical protein